MPANPLEEISKLQQQIAQLTDAAVGELKARRADLENELKAVDAELEKLTGKPARAGTCGYSLGRACIGTRSRSISCRLRPLVSGTLRQK